MKDRFIIFLFLSVALSSCTLSLKNDVLSHTDEDFTHGTEFIYNKDIEAANKYLRKIAQAIPDITFGEAEDPTHVSAKIGQHIYTPSDLSREDIIEEDNPYAGWLFGEVKRQVLREDYRRQVGLALGIIGRNSGAEFIQKFVHNDLGRGRDPKGWDHQLGHELGVVGSLEQSEVFFRYHPGGWEVDGIHGAELRLGNVHTDFKYGPQIRFGKGLPSFEGYDEHWSLYGYTGGNLRAVGRNIFYDGNTFSDSHRVGSEPLVADIGGGLITQIEGWEVGLHYTYTTPEHKRRESGGHSIWFLSISKALDLFD